MVLFIAKYLGKIHLIYLMALVYRLVNDDLDRSIHVQIEK